MVPLPAFYSSYVEWADGHGEFYLGVVTEGEK